MNGDPIEESSQAVRQGFVQSLQTAHTTAALMRGRGSDTRSRVESEQRLNDADAKEQRSILEHRQRMSNASQTADQSRALNEAKIEEIDARRQRGGELHGVELQKGRRQIERGDEDLQRRNTAGELERAQKTAIHRKQIQGYTNREERAVELHALDVEYKQLLIAIRKRAAGFGETLSELGDTGDTMTSIAAFAGAQASADVSEPRARDAESYTERLFDDSGYPSNEVLEMDVTGVAATWEPSGPWTAALDELVELTEYLTAANYLGPDIGNDIDVSDPEATGSVIADAISATEDTSATATETPHPDDTAWTDTDSGADLLRPSPTEDPGAHP